MTFAEILLRFGNEIRAGNPRLIALLVVLVLALFALLFGVQALIVMLRILMPFWVTALVYGVCYYLVRLYKKRHPDFAYDMFATIGLTGFILIIIVALA